MGHGVNVAGSKIGFGQLRGLGHENDLRSVRAEIVVARVAKRLIRDLWASKGSINAQKEVGQASAEAEARAVSRGVASSKRTREERVSFLLDIGVPVSDPDTVVESSCGGRDACKLLVVGRSIVGVGQSIDQEVDTAR